MNVNRYLSMTCKYKPCVSTENSEYGLEYGTEETIKCFTYDNAGTFGKASFQISEGAITSRATKAYIVTDTRVKEGDLLDGRVVNNVDIYTDLRGAFQYKLCSVI